MSIFQVSLSKIDFTQKPLRLKRLWKIGENILTTSESIVDTTRGDRILCLLQVVTKRYLCHRTWSPLPALHTCQQVSKVGRSTCIVWSNERQATPLRGKTGLRHTLNILCSHSIDVCYHLINIAHMIT